jgi:hypothetical protein
MACNTTRQNCTPASVFAGIASPGCGQFFNPYNFQAEQLVYDAAFNDIINKNYLKTTSYRIIFFYLFSFFSSPLHRHPRKTLVF